MTEAEEARDLVLRLLSKKKNVEAAKAVMEMDTDIAVSVIVDIDLTAPEDYMKNLNREMNKLRR